MRSVAVVATGKTAFGSFPELSIRELAREAGAKCLKGSKAAPAQVEALYVGNFAGPSFVGQSHLAPYIGSALGLEGVPCTRFEAACASSGSAFFHAYSAIAGGLYDLVLVVGVEKMTSQTTARTTDILASAGDLGGEVKAGATFPSLFAMIAKRHMHDFGTTREHLAAVAVKNHANGAKNPLAHLRKPITIEKALAGRMIAEPLTLYDCSLISDGAAAVLLCASDRATESRTSPYACAAWHKRRTAWRSMRRKTSARFQPSERPVRRLSGPPVPGQRTLMSPSCTTVLRSPRSLRSRT